jgi:ABC-type Fe3+ transport system permease subunit
MSAPPTSTTTPVTGAPRPAVPIGVEFRPAKQRPQRMRRSYPERWMAFAGLCCVCIAFLFPLLWMLSTSLKTLPKTMENPPRYIPDEIELYHTPGGRVTPIPKNYVDVITHDKMDFPRYTRNTLWIAILSIMGTVLSSSLVAYGFAKIDFKGAITPRSRCSARCGRCGCRRGSGRRSISFCFGSST